MLTTCTELSRKRIEKAMKDAAGHKEIIMQVNRGYLKRTIKIYIQMKTDLELIFRKIRYFKSTLAAKYPQIYQQGKRLALKREAYQNWLRR